VVRPRGLRFDPGDTGGGFAELTIADVRFWMFWLGVDYILYR
jgi:hypothetical protein